MSEPSSERRLAVVPFCGDELQVVGETVAEAWVPTTPVCEAFGMDAQAQRRRLERAKWARVAVMATVAPDGRCREMHCIHLDSFPMWLATIEAGRVAEGLRPKLVKYQREARDVLAAHFVTPTSAAVATLDPYAMALVKAAGEAIAGPIVGSLLQIEKKQDEQGKDLAVLKIEVTDLRTAVQTHLRHKRKEPSEKTCKTHVAFCRSEMRSCIVNGVPLFDKGGTWIGQIHHIHDASDASLRATMAICPECNQRFNKEPMPRHFAETYQDRLRKWLTPGLLKLMKIA